MDKLTEQKIIEVFVSTGKNGKSYLDGMCNAYTKGMDMAFDHPDFQVVLHLIPEGEIYYLIFGEMISRVANGERFEDGEIINSEAFPNRIRFEKHYQNGKELLRLVFSDEHDRFPEDNECDDIFKLQSFETEELYDDVVLN